MRYVVAFLITFYTAYSQAYSWVSLDLGTEENASSVIMTTNEYDQSIRFECSDAKLSFVLKNLADFSDYSPNDAIIISYATSTRPVRSDEWLYTKDDQLSFSDNNDHARALFFELLSSEILIASLSSDDGYISAEFYTSGLKEVAKSYINACPLLLN